MYAKDHATGKDAQTSADIIEELETNIDDTNHNVGNGLDGIHEDVSCTQIPTTGGRVEGISAWKRKKKGQNNEDNMMQEMKEVASMLGSQLKDASDNLSKAVIGTIASENRSRINQELSKVVGLTIKERHKATKLIVCQHELIDVFFSVPIEENEEWVKGLINGDF